MKTFLAFSLNILLILTLNAQHTKKIYYNNIINNLQPEDQEKPLVFVDFWATWCAPCISSMPHTIALQKQYGDKISFVYISNEPSYKVENFLKRKAYQFHALIDNKRKTEDEFNVQSIPNSFLLNPDGEIIWHGKPTEISPHQLQRFIDAYKDEKGQISRFEFAGELKKEKEKWNEFSCNKADLYFYEEPQIENNFYQNNNKFFVSGDLKYILSFINDYPINHIQSKVPPKYFRFKAEMDDLSLFKKIINKFLRKNYSYKINVKENNQEVYYVKDLNDDEFMDRNTYNYERGDAQFIQNNISIKIDNATPKEVFMILDNITSLNFIYKGNNKNKYDWNLIYVPSDALLLQLKQDLNFSIEKKEKKVATYEIISR